MKLSRSVGEVVESSDLDKLQCKNETMETTSVVIPYVRRIYSSTAPISGASWLLIIRSGYPVIQFQGRVAPIRGIVLPISSAESTK